MAASQYHIAELTGFSRSTVSRALANHPSITVETKQLVQAAAKKLGYKTNPLVSILTAQLRKSRVSPIKSTLAYVTTYPKAEIGNVLSHYEFYLGAKEHAEELGYELDIIWRREPSMSAKRFNAILQARSIRGVIIAPRPTPLGHITMDYSRVAAAAVGHPLPSPHISHSSAWHIQLMSLALRKIVKQGYKRLGYAIFSASDRYSNFSFSSRFANYQMQVSPKYRVPMLVVPWKNQQPSQQQFESWFKKHKPEVILCTGDAVPGWLQKMGLKAPQDVAYADLTLGRRDSAISGVYERPRKVGACAVDLVVEQMQQNILGVPEIPKSILIEGEWVDGTTL